MEALLDFFKGTHDVQSNLVSVPFSVQSFDKDLDARLNFAPLKQSERHKSHIDSISLNASAAAAAESEGKAFKLSNEENDFISR